MLLVPICVLWKAWLKETPTVCGIPIFSHCVNKI